MSEVTTLIGKKVATSKSNGKKYYTYYFSKTFSDYELDNCECSGFSVFEEGCGLDFPDIHIGDEVDIAYGKGFQNTPVVKRIDLVKPNPFKNDSKK